MHSPRLLFLDEPTSGVDPSPRRAFWDLIYELSQDGVTVLVTTHYMDEAEYCERVEIMRQGRLLALDTPVALKSTVVPGRVWEIFARALAPRWPCSMRVRRSSVPAWPAITFGRLRLPM